MNHSFNIKIANEHSVNEAIIIENIAFWTTKNIANKRNFFDGRWWVYNSVKAWSKLFPYWSEKVITNIIKKLEDKKVLLVGNYNKASYDRTKWYSLDIGLYDTFYNIYPNGQMELPKRSNANTQTVKPIPVINTDVISDINNNIDQNKILEDNINEIYKAYPKKVGKVKALPAIKKALTKISFDKLLPIVVLFAKYRKNEDPQYTPHPASWFNGERWNDIEDYKPKNNFNKPGSTAKFNSLADPRLEMNQSRDLGY